MADSTESPLRREQAEWREEVARRTVDVGVSRGALACSEALLRTAQRLRTHAIIGQIRCERKLAEAKEQPCES